MSDQANEEQALYDLARQYHDRCDAYDRAVCTARSPRSGEPMPANGKELGLINKNARHVINEIMLQSGITEAKLHQAIVHLESTKGDH